MLIETKRAIEIATQVKRLTRNPDMLDLCDYVLASKPMNITPNTIIADCPKCQARRNSKAASQRRWRNKPP